jgi:predicted nuclease of restriction endonuclease-like (RecB) superfamily
MEIENTEYKNWLVALKSKIRSTQIKAAIAVNSALIVFYWELGKMISEKQTAWGSKFLETLSKDLQDEFPEMKGFSVSNLKFCKLFYNYFSIRSQLENEISENLFVQLPWGHIKLIITKIKEKAEAEFYFAKTKII